MKIGIIVSEFNENISERLLKGAERGLKKAKVAYDVVHVPGAFEIPLAALRMAKTKKYDALIALGCVIKGDTDHYEMICRACVDGIVEVMLDEEIPIAFEVLMTKNEKLALARCKNDETNKGYIAVEVALKMAK
ncbi:MAG: 6,7-dimethyl-8-ribityllumazine synthase [Candidatus Gracilibacteria bacterium]